VWIVSLLLPCAAVAQHPAFEVASAQPAPPPDWVGNAGYDILAKVPQNTNREQLGGMLRTLLAERFHWITHRESKVLPVYALVAGKNGPKLKEVTGEPAAGANIRMGPAGARIWGKMRISQLVGPLSGVLDHPVLDMTDLPGIYEIDLSWVSEESGWAEAKAASMEKVTPVDSNASTSVFAALQDKRGLKLEARKSPIEILVVDQVDKVPTAN
jgi:uncharacterized protein (TIGR03435 family)